MDTQIIDVKNISRFKKEKYIASLSEDDFRDQVIRPLFLRLGYKDGRDLCGPSEEGKDAVFYELNRLGQKEYLAVQTKRGKLNMASKASQNLISAIVQLQTALATPIALIKEKTTVYPSKVYLCASGKINNTARSHITSETRDTRIHFLDSDEVIPLIDEHFPELWLGIDVELLPYLRSLREFIEGARTTSDSNYILGSILSGAASDATYIEINIYRTRILTKKSHGNFIKTHEIEEFPLKDILDKQLNICLLLGDAGYGKTTALYRLAYLQTKKIIETSDEYKIPVVIRASELSKSPHTAVEEYGNYVAKKLANTTRPCFTIQDLN